MILEELSALREQNAEQRNWMLTQDVISEQIKAQLNSYETANQQLMARMNGYEEVNQRLATTIVEQDKVIQQLTAKEVPNQYLRWSEYICP